MKINLNNEIKSVIKEDNLPGGLGDDATAESLASKHDVPLELIELMIEWGIAVEMEHTDDEEIAKEIAMDHVTEDPMYYYKLKEMESE